MQQQIDKKQAQCYSPRRAHQKIYYFLFINTKSGNKQGLNYCQLASKKLNYVFATGLLVTVELFDLFDAPRARLGFQLARKLTQQQNQKADVRIIICGGDGTIPWVLGSALENRINFEKITIGIQPIGTGNDFSRSVGWGFKAINFDRKDFSSLHSMVSQWNRAQVGYYDIWDIQVEAMQRGGAFYEIKDQQQVKRPQRVLKKCFTNYFGIGLDARIVYSVEKNRGSNAFINKLLYTLVGAKKLFESMESVAETIEYFRVVPQEQLPSQELISCSDSNMVSKEAKQDQLTGKQPKKLQREENITKQIANGQFQLKSGYKGLVCLNCTSYMCGLRNVWMTKKSTNKSIGIENNKQPQHFDDGKLEFMSFNNQLTLALQRVTRTGVRICQGGGPFEIKFKQKNGINTTFMQIDGESVKVENIKCIRVRKSLAYPEGRIRVLIKKED